MESLPVLGNVATSEGVEVDDRLQARTAKPVPRPRPDRPWSVRGTTSERSRATAGRRGRHGGPGRGPPSRPGRRGSASAAEQELRTSSRSSRARSTSPIRPRGWPPRNNAADRPGVNQGDGLGRTSSNFSTWKRDRIASTIPFKPKKSRPVRRVRQVGRRATAGRPVGGKRWRFEEVDVEVAVGLVCGRGRFRRLGTRL